MPRDPRLAWRLFQASLRNYPTPAVAGVYHRKRSTTQSIDDDLRQTRSGMLWGRVPRGGKCPTVQAYFGPLPPEAAGIEFVTPIRPQHVGLPAGFGANWHYDDTAFVGLLAVADVDYAVIPIVVTRVQS